MATFDDSLIKVVGHASDHVHNNGCEHNNVSTPHRELCRESTSLLKFNDEPVDDQCSCFIHLKS